MQKGRHGGLAGCRCGGWSFLNFYYTLVLLLLLCLTARLVSVFPHLSMRFAQNVNSVWKQDFLLSKLSGFGFNTMPLFLQSSVQDWGEEVEDGAVYNVTLKRVQIQQAANKGARWLGVNTII